MHRFVNDIPQGQKFVYNGKLYLKVPDFCECYGHSFNALNVKTGTAMYIPNQKVIQLVKTMKVVARKQKDK